MRLSSRAKSPSGNSEGAGLVMSNGSRGGLSVPVAHLKIGSPIGPVRHLNLAAPSFRTGSKLEFARQGAVLHGSAGCGGWLCEAEWHRRAGPRLTSDARLALQAEPSRPPSHSASEAQGHELGRLRRQLAPAWQPERLVH